MGKTGIFRAKDFIGNGVGEIILRCDIGERGWEGIMNRSMAKCLKKDNSNDWVKIENAGKLSNSKFSDGVVYGDIIECAEGYIRHKILPGFCLLMLHTGINLSLLNSPLAGNLYAA